MGTKVDIDWAVVKKLAEAGCSGSEISSRIGIHRNTLSKNCEKMHKMQWQEYLQQCKASGDSLLREKQFEVAMNGDKTMLVWLGKQRLNQTEKQTIQHNLDNVELSKLSDSELEQLAARDK